MPVVVNSNCTVTTLLLLLQVGGCNQLDTAVQVAVQVIAVGNVN